MKKVYLYSAVLLSLLFNLGFFLELRKNEANRSNVNVSDEYLNEQLDMSYSCLKLNGSSILNVEGTLWNAGSKVENVELQTQLDGINIILYFSELSCATCIKEHLYSLTKSMRKMKNLKVILMTNYSRNNLLDEIVRLNMHFSVFELGDNSIKILTDMNNRYPTATIALLMKDSHIVSSFISNSATNHFNINFYDSIYRYYQAGVL